MVHFITKTNGYLLFNKVELPVPGRTRHVARTQGQSKVLRTLIIVILVLLICFVFHRVEGILIPVLTSRNRCFFAYEHIPHIEKNFSMFKI